MAAESMSVLTDPATYGKLNSELANCPRTAAVLGTLAAQWQQMMGTLQRTERNDGRPTTIEGRRTTLPKELVRHHTTWRLCTRGRCVAGMC